MNQEQKNDARLLSIERATQLDRSATSTNTDMEAAKTYDDVEYKKAVADRKAVILKFFGATEIDWRDSAWQMQHRIDNVKTLNEIFKLTPGRHAEIAEAGARFRWSVTPYYLSLLDPNNTWDEIGLMALPSHFELTADEEASLDPMAEEHTNPAGTITRRYPDRLIINVTSTCAMLCRHCQRRRNFGSEDHHTSADNIAASIEYIRNTPCIRDVLITGGDALALSDNKLESIISAIRDIPHVEIIRLGTRMPATLPQRITHALAVMLRRYHPLYINVHFNHPKEFTEETKNACNLLADAGISLGNQMVLLNGVNNNKHVVLRLNRELLKVRVKPYYIFHPKSVVGTMHFGCDIQEGLDIMDHLIGNTTGMAKPYYILNASGGLGKVPLLNQKFRKTEDGKYEITTWEDKIVTYP